MLRIIIRFACLSCLLSSFDCASGQNQAVPGGQTLESKAPGTSSIAWAGKGAYRLLVKVDPEDIGNRSFDVMPTDLAIDLASKLKEIGISAKADLCSLQVIRYDPETGQPLPFPTGYLYGIGPDDRPFRWYDAAIPYDFPQILGPITYVNGELRYSNKLRHGYFFNTMGDWNAGHLAWSHTQNGNSPSYYAIYFNLLANGEEPTQVPPRGWLGDGMPCADRWGTTTTGMGDVTITLDDWYDDGRTDIVVGEQYGNVFVYPNRGSQGYPDFPYARMIFDDQGRPIDIGLHSSPLVVDWDGDGVKDLLLGVYENRVVWYKNVGTNRDRKFVYKGYIKADGKDLQLPFRPILGRPEAPFTNDYYPVMQWVDWYGTGRPGLLAGGYVTGRIYFFENTGTAPDGTPLLKFRGPIDLDGKPLNVGDWCASPCAADFRGVGKLDLISGSYAMSDDARKNYSLLRYYENIGSKTHPILKERPFPKKGNFPSGSMAVPRAVDFGGHGLLDLVVSTSGGEIYIFRNIGTAQEPLFDVDVPPIRNAWGNSTLSTHQFIDWRNDGYPDYVESYQVHLNSHLGNPYQWDKVVNVLQPGAMIAHPYGIGDDWFWPYLCDFRKTGNFDVLFGDWAGNIWMHRNLGTRDKPQFDLTGYRLKTTDGQDIKVGPINVDIHQSFRALQGDRTTFAVGDVDGDGNNDLVVADTYGIIRFYRNAGTNENPVFDPPIVVGNVHSDSVLDVDDWYNDGRLDIIVGSADHEVHLFRNIGTKGHAQFDSGTKLNLPWVLEPRAIMVDMDHDGNKDLFLLSTQGSVLINKFFALHGYALRS